MWRSLRNIFWKRNGSPANLRLGQVQAAENNEDTNPLFLSVDIKEYSVPRHGKPLEIDRDLVQLDEGFNLARAIILRAGREHEIVRPVCFVGGEKDDNENSHCGSILDEIKLWFTGVLALSGVLSCRNFIFDEDHKVDIKKIPLALYYISINNPRIALAVLPVVQRDQPALSETSGTEAEDSLTDAVTSFATTSNECTAVCQNKLGAKYAERKQYQKAFALFQQASEHGHSLAQFNLGLCYENGKGIAKDLEKAAVCYKKASALNHNGALYNLALFYMEGLGGLPKDQSKAIELLEFAAQSGLHNAQSYLGIYYAEKSSNHIDYSKAVSYLEKAAFKKDAAAEHHLGICYEHGLGVERNVTMAGHMYKAAAKHGNLSAQYNLGVFYEHGLGDFPVDHKEALRYYRMASEAGDEDAQHNYLLLSKQDLPEKKTYKSFVDHDILLNFFHQIHSQFNTINPSEESQGITHSSSSPGLINSQLELNSKDVQPASCDGSLVAF